MERHYPEPTTQDNLIILTLYLFVILGLLGGLLFLIKSLLGIGD